MWKLGPLYNHLHLVRSDRATPSALHIDLCGGHRFVTAQYLHLFERNAGAGSLSTRGQSRSSILVRRATELPMTTRGSSSPGNIESRIRQNFCFRADGTART